MSVCASLTSMFQRICQASSGCILDCVGNDKVVRTREQRGKRKGVLPPWLRAKTGEVPFNYVGILHVESLDEFYEKGAPSQKFQDLLAKMMPMFKNIHILYGEEIYMINTCSCGWS